MTITDRDFRPRRYLIKDVLTVATSLFLLQACGGKPSVPSLDSGASPIPVPEAPKVVSESPSAVVEAPTQPVVESVLKNRGLMPEVLPGRTISSAQAAESIYYLGRVADELDNNPQFVGSALNQLGVGSEDQWPIDYDGPITAVDTIRNIQQGYRNGQIIFVDSTNPEDTFILGTVNNPIFDESGWHLQQVISINTAYQFMDVTEEDGTVYSNYTNAQLGFKVVHEFGHFKEDQKILKMVLLESGKEIEQSGNDPAVVRRLMEQKVEQLNKTLNLDPRVMGKFDGNVLFYEMPPNLMSMSIMDSLINLNGGHRVPGFRDDNPWPRNDDDLYYTYRRTIAAFKNPFDPDWLKFYISK